MGYRTHAELMQAWDLLRLIAWHPSLETALLIGDKPSNGCLIMQARKLLVDPPQSDPVAHTKHLQISEEVR